MNVGASLLTRGTALEMEPLVLNFSFLTKLLSLLLNGLCQPGLTDSSFLGFHSSNEIYSFLRFVSTFDHIIEYDEVC